MKLNELLNHSYDNDHGILHTLELNDWMGSENLKQFFKAPIDTTALDLMYLGRSGQKEISTYVEVYLKSPDFVRDPVAYLYVLISSRCLNKWDKLAKDFIQQYNIIEPYKVNESEEIDMSYDGNKSTNSKITTTNSGRTDDNIYGFNSSEAKGTTLSMDENSNIVQGSSDDNYETDNKTETGTKTRTKTGNLGNHSYAELISKDIELWKNDFIEIIFKDMDKILTRPLYSY